jgi:Asp-tRNA(Asn)/Glu-tRNA(Gln) amidotransferase A subunit family amidase
VVGLPLAYPWGDLSSSAQNAIERAGDAMRRVGIEVWPVQLPVAAAAAFDAHADAQGFEAVTALWHEFNEHAAQLSPLLRDYLLAARSIDASAYERGLAVAATARSEMTGWLGDCDALLTPRAPDQPAEGYGSTGPSTSNSLWTLLGWPCVSVPRLTGDSGAPMGVPLIGPAGSDAGLLELAGRLEQTLRGAPATGGRVGRAA